MLIGSVALGRALDCDTDINQLLQSCRETVFESLELALPEQGDVIDEFANPVGDVDK